MKGLAMEENKVIESEKKIIKCLNCGTEFYGKFCPECGQRADTKRFTIRFIFTNLLQAILSNDGGVWITLKLLFTKPGRMVVDIINGKRKSYFSPFPMLFLTISLYLVICAFTGSRVGAFDLDDMKAKYTESIENAEEDETTMFVNKTRSHIITAIALYKDHYTTVMALTIPLYIFAARISYGKKNRRRYNWGEYCIPVVYATVVIFLYNCISSICFAFSESLYDSLDTWSPIISITAFSMCFKKMLEFSVIKTVWRTVVLHVVYIMTLAFLVVALVMLFIIIHLEELKALAS